MSESKIIEVDGVSKSYEVESVFEDLSFSIFEGEIFCLLGPNGCGKTTIIEMLMGRESYDSGSIIVKDYEASENSSNIMSEIGVVPEKEEPFDFLTPREHLHFVGRTRNLSKEHIKKRIDELSDILGFSEHLDTMSKDLSRGNQQKVMISQALVHKPDLLVIDEPIANLDPFVQEALKDFLKKYNNETGATILLSTHHIEFALEICERGILIGDSIFDLEMNNISKKELISKYSGEKVI